MLLREHLNNPRTKKAFVNKWKECFIIFEGLSSGEKIKNSWDQLKTSIPHNIEISKLINWFANGFSMMSKFDPKYFGNCFSVHKKNLLRDWLGVSYKIISKNTQRYESKWDFTNLRFKSGFCRRIIWVFLTILWGWRLKG